ncbi:MAG: NAD-dependent epimerase/dehydratase family protein [Lewinellaceae bacterium]|nr:NAD-dependent epimerase/dehydratase family protein [Lewinellaceae bacterium]
MDAETDVDYVVNLAGAGIDKRWTGAKKELIESRVKSAATLYQAMERMAMRPKAYLSAAAVGIYGNSGETWIRERDHRAI